MTVSMHLSNDLHLCVVIGYLIVQKTDDVVAWCPLQSVVGRLSFSGHATRDADFCMTRVAAQNLSPHALNFGESHHFEKHA